LTHLKHAVAIGPFSGWRFRQFAKAGVTLALWFCADWFSPALPAFTASCPASSAGWRGFALDSIPNILPNAGKSTRISDAMRDDVPAPLLTGPT